MSQYLSQTDYNQVNNNLIDQQQFIASHLTGRYIQQQLQQPNQLHQQHSQQPISPTDHFLLNNVSGRSQASQAASMQRFYSDPGTYQRMPVSAGGGPRSSKSLPKPSQPPAIRKHRRAISAASPHTVMIADTSAEQQMVIPPHTAYTLPVTPKNSMNKTDDNGNYINIEKPDNGDVTSTLVENEDLGLSQLELDSRGCASLDLQSGTAGRTNKHTPLSQVLEVFRCQPVKSIFVKKNSLQNSNHRVIQFHIRSISNANKILRYSYTI